MLFGIAAKAFQYANSILRAKPRQKDCVPFAALQYVSRFPKPLGNITRIQRLHIHYQLRHYQSPSLVRTYIGKAWGLKNSPECTNPLRRKMIAR